MMREKNILIAISIVLTGCTNKVDTGYKTLEGNWAPVIVGCNSDIMFKIEKGILQNATPLNTTSMNIPISGIKIRLYDLKMISEYRGTMKGEIIGATDNVKFEFHYTPNHIAIMDFENKKLLDDTTLSDDEKKKSLSIYDLEKCAK